MNGRKYCRICRTARMKTKDGGTSAGWPCVAGGSVGDRLVGSGAVLVGGRSVDNRWVGGLLGSGTCILVGGSVGELVDEIVRALVGGLVGGSVGELVVAKVGAKVVIGPPASIVLLRVPS